MQLIEKPLLLFEQYQLPSSCHQEIIRGIAVKNNGVIHYKKKSGLEVSKTWYICICIADSIELFVKTSVDHYS